MKKPVRITEGQLHKIIKESVNKILNEIIGDGTFPNADALVNNSQQRVEQALLNAGFRLDEYGDDMNGDGVGYFVNDETGEEVEVTYKWNKVGDNKFKAGKVKDAYVWRDNGEDSWVGKQTVHGDY